MIHIYSFIYTYWQVQEYHNLKFIKSKSFGHKQYMNMSLSKLCTYIYFATQVNFISKTTR